MDSNIPTPTPFQSGQKQDNKVFKMLSIEFVVFFLLNNCEEFKVFVIFGRVKIRTATFRCAEAWRM